MTQVCLGCPELTMDCKGQCITGRSGPEWCLPRSNLQRSVVNVNVCAWRVMGALGYWVMMWVGKEWCSGTPGIISQSHVFGS